MLYSHQLGRVQTPAAWKSSLTWPTTWLRVVVLDGGQIAEGHGSVVIDHSGKQGQTRKMFQAF